MNYSQRRAWADKFLPQQFEILNNHVDVLDFNKAKRRGIRIDIAPDFDDQNLETDAIMFGTLRIALRVRRGQSSDFNDIALRSELASGNPTELQKIREGFGDYYLYCWTIDGENITEWLIIDLDRFREEMDSRLFPYVHYNDDGSAFTTYSIPTLIHRDCCVSSSLEVLT